MKRDGMKIENDICCRQREREGLNQIKEVWRKGRKEEDTLNSDGVGGESS